MHRVLAPRLSHTEVRELGKAAAQLAAAAGILKTTNWAGAPAVFVLIQQVYERIAPIYNRGEGCLREFRQGRGVSPIPEPPAEPTTQEQPSLENPAAPAELEA